MRLGNIDFHTQGRLVLNVRHAAGTPTYWIEITDQHRGTSPALFSDLPEHILIDACKAFNKVISESMEGVDEKGSL